MLIPIDMLVHTARGMAQQYLDDWRVSAEEVGSQPHNV